MRYKLRYKGYNGSFLGIIGLPTVSEMLCGINYGINAITVHVFTPGFPTVSEMFCGMNSGINAITVFTAKPEARTTLFRFTEW